MRVLIVGEGDHELGKTDIASALQTLICRIAGREFVCDAAKVSEDNIHVHHGKGRGYFKKAVGWLLEARKRGYDAVVVLIDEDGQGDRVRQLDDAQQYNKVEFRRALGVAIRSFDAWMLADETALTKVLRHSVGRQRDPEDLRSPKDVCEALLDTSSCGLSLTEMYASVAQQLDLTVLANRCPRGFGPFAERVRRL